MASFGFSADFATSLTAQAKRRWGKLGYAIMAARLLAGSNLFKAWLEHDGTVEELRIFQILVGNGATTVVAWPFGRMPRPWSACSISTA